ncbi:protein FAM3D isoform X2 [Hippopotamus amphibius kiboko]|uniref:protein FAM3D isoform X2 n=1 Tax=Hippopotamus amphibius kiboko TaxID=575201 RepID=UPI00259527D8|nr:protein FAM3D isoform X2 [Hippopotamus amphibius kiboko]
MRVSGLRRLLALIFVLVTALVFVRSYINVNMKTIRLPRWMGSVHKEKPSQPVKTKCGLSTSCPDHSFAFKITSGAANVVGPSICFEDQTIMSPVKNNVGRGLNIALVNDADVLVKFLKEIPEGTLVLVASYDDPGTKVNDDIKKLFSNLGSTYAKQLGFRDSWVFLGARDLKNKSPFEQFLKNNPENNKYEGWPELLEMGGCVPRKV